MVVTRLWRKHGADVENHAGAGAAGCDSRSPRYGHPQQVVASPAGPAPIKHRQCVLVSCVTVWLMRQSWSSRLWKEEVNETRAAGRLKGDITTWRRGVHTHKGTACPMPEQPHLRLLPDAARAPGHQSRSFHHPRGTRHMVLMHQLDRQKPPHAGRRRLSGNATSQARPTT